MGFYVLDEVLSKAGGNSFKIIVYPLSHLRRLYKNILFGNVFFISFCTLELSKCFLNMS